MKVILHIGAHRTGSTSFQSYMGRNRGALQAQGVTFWGPTRTRKGLFAGIQPVPGIGKQAAKRARGRILMQLDKAEKAGAHTVLISDENVMGSVRMNLRTRRLYPDIGERLARYVAAFDGRIDQIALNIRGLELYWASAAAYGIARGHSPVGAEACNRIASARRTWRDVISDAACAAPDAKVQVLPFECFAGRPEAMLSAMSSGAAPNDPEAIWLNRAPSIPALKTLLSERGEDPAVLPDGAGRWMPFDAAQTAQLRELYHEDMHWLIAGADGLATLTETPDRERAGTTPPFGPPIRGQHDGEQERRMAHPG